MTERDFTEAEPASERRQSDRKKLIVDVRFDGGEATGIANTRDISLGGLYLTTHAKLANETRILMLLTLGGKEIALTGVVVHSDQGQGVGVRFENVSDRAAELLKSELKLS